MSIPLVKVDQYTVTGLPEPAAERDGRVRCGQHVTALPGDSRLHVVGFGYVTGEVAMQLVRELLAGYCVMEQDQAARS
jgi:hypothetical protein